MDMMLMPTAACLLVAVNHCQALTYRVERRHSSSLDGRSCIAAILCRLPEVHKATGRDAPARQLPSFARLEHYSLDLLRACCSGVFNWLRSVGGLAAKTPGHPEEDSADAAILEAAAERLLARTT